MTDKKNFVDQIKEAGANVGGVVGDFADRLRADDGVLDTLKDAAREAKEGISEAEKGEDVKKVAGEFASYAENLLKGLGEAAEGTKDSVAFEKARGFIDSVRLQAKDASERVKDSDGVAGDAARSLDELMERLRGTFSTSEKKGAGDIIDGEVIADNDGK